MENESRMKLAAWYETIHPRRIDIVGDFGGKQLFFIDGDSLLLHSVTTLGVDYDIGFQLLHAIFAVESFLKNLQVRGCRFHIVFFDNQVRLCTPSATPQCMSYKFEMTRTILVRHLQLSANRTFWNEDTGLVYLFPSIDSEQFHQHLAQYPASFLMCHDGQTASGRSTQNSAVSQYMIHQFLQMRHSVALIHGTEFRSSRVIVPMITAAPRIRSLTISPRLLPISGSRELEELSKPSYALYQGRSYRELLTVVALHRVLQSERDENHRVMATAMILHSVVISCTRLAERASTSRRQAQQCVSEFLSNFCQQATKILESELGDSLASDLYWDLFDLVDGTLFLSLHTALSTGQHVPATLISKAKPLITCVEQWASISLLGNKYVQTLTGSEVESPVTQTTSIYDPSKATILPFSHGVLNKFLASVHLQTTDVHEETSESKVFRELTHWHNAKKGLEAKGAQKKPGFYARKRNQEFMADTLAYSASLVNASGKLIEPKTIIVDVSAPSKKAPTNRTAVDASKGKKKIGSATGKNNARETALLIQSRKLKERSSDTFRHWHTVARDFSQEKALIGRFQKANKYFLSLTKEDRLAIGAEVSLYLCDTLYRAWEERVVATSSQPALSIGSLLFNQIIETSKLPGSTQEISAALQLLSSAIGISSQVLTNQPLLSRHLGFQPRILESSHPTLPTLGSYEFQLGHCGPFLERSFDSRKDDRVPFEPDAWQVSVLDSIDANDGLFIVAPTSSGKTFISFYAMEKILRADNDGVLVYVAPTKALVNQIAAEIQARFKKSYHHKGRSVWAIHTRDYRVNNPTGCQILVTVPHVLQIMLLSPTNANSWSKRVKRIIFDEVHCIGQADDGIVWEQLLLMAPCPIIALSATVGNPEEFCDWLRVSQTSKGFNFKMITHGSRYSDLRAFHYAPSERVEFGGLHRREHLPVPGLDGSNRASSNFEYIHPIATLGNRTGVDLEELSLEPRDALSLWTSMDKFQTNRFPLDESLHPSRICSSIPKKSDVLAWTKRLKSVLAVWMQDESSPFDQICRDLEPGSPNTQVIQQTYTTPTQSSLKIERLRTFALLIDLHKGDGLPAILFNYDRVECERVLELILEQLQSKEEEWKTSDRGWQKKIRDFNVWRASGEGKRPPKKSTEKLTKQERMREDASAEVSQWESFDPEKPLEQFSFADNSRLTPSELQGFIDSLKDEIVKPHLFSALERGIAVHHAGMNRKYRQVVEILFRKGYLTAVIATGTLALGINMPCKTVAFIGESLFLTTLNYRQGAGRAGRRGFDLLGNVVFTNISRTRAHELMASRLPDLKGHFPLTTTLILRLLGLVDAAGESTFVLGIVESLLTQNRLYLGGEEAGKCIQHHLRFSVEYLQRQHLLSANGKPINFAGLVGHLYFTENAVFAFHSLLKSGYFHRLCSNIRRDASGTLRKMCLVLAHLFNRIRVHNLGTDSASFTLPRLPKEAEDLLILHNNETLEIFKAYAGTYINQYLHNVPDRHLPFSGIAVGGEEPRMLQLAGDLPATKLRSPFSALSGFSDEFKSIRDLCSNIRSGVFLEESAVPYIPIWPHDVSTAFNSYIYDFFKDGDYDALTRDNRIKQGDVWFLLRDFSLVLATIVTSLTNFVRAENIVDDDLVGFDDYDEEVNDKDTIPKMVETTNHVKHDTSLSKITKAKVVESWEDEDDDDDNYSGTEDRAVHEKPNKLTATPLEPPIWEGEGRGLADVLEAFTLLKQDFDEKFHKVWA